MQNSTKYIVGGGAALLGAFVVMRGSGKTGSGSGTPTGSGSGSGSGTKFTVNLAPATATASQNGTDQVAVTVSPALPSGYAIHILGNGGVIMSSQNSSFSVPWTPKTTGTAQLSWQIVDAAGKVVQSGNGPSLNVVLPTYSVGISPSSSDPTMNTNDGLSVSVSPALSTGYSVKILANGGVIGGQSF